MSKLHDFLVEHAKFPFSPLDGHLSTTTTDISTFEVGLLEKEWKAKLVVRDNNLIQNLCGALEHILGDARLADADESDLLASFAPKIQFPERGGEDEDWSSNPHETWVSDVHHSKPSNFELTLGAESEFAKQVVLRRRR